MSNLRIYADKENIKCFGTNLIGTAYFLFKRYSFYILKNFRLNE